MRENPSIPRRAKKSLGQNFLMHRATAERIVRAAELPLGATVLEVGPGRGALTRALLKEGAVVVAVEADRDLLPLLGETFASELTSGALTLVEGDIRAFDLSALPDTYHVVANIPYYLTGELFRIFLSAAHQPRSLTFLVQKEVAERIVGRKPLDSARGKESILSLSVKAYGTPHIAFTVPKGAFVPAPKVNSAVLTISNISRKNFASPEVEQRFFELLHAGFAHKRKLLRSNLAQLGVSFEHIPEKIRAEDLPLHNWLTLAHST